jgi:hypothetical protein
MARKTRRNRTIRRSKSRKNIVSKTIQKGTVLVNETSKKVMPKVKTGLENVGSKVIKSSKRSIPYLQRLTRKLFSKFAF